MNDDVPGTYLLVMRLDTSCNVQVGRLGPIRFLPGRYLYVGSALGSGGLRARVARHTRVEKRRHWHIDYLLAQAELLEAWVMGGTVRRECQWAHALSILPGVWAPIRGFGASECGCESHLFALEQRPVRHVLESALGAQLEPVPLDSGHTRCSTPS